MATQHNDVEFRVGEVCFDRFPEAAALAMMRGLGTGAATIDVLVHSEAGARHHGGEDAVAQYREDPDASVFERFVITITNMGRVP